MSLPSTVCLIQDITLHSGKVRILGTVLAYDIHRALVLIEFLGHQIQVDVSTLLVTRVEGGLAQLKIVIGETVNLIGYVEQLYEDTQELVIRVVMYWPTTRMTDEDKRKYAEIVKARTAYALLSD